MKGYESIFITDPELSEEVLGALLEKTKGIIIKFGGTTVQYHLWGKRRLAYTINKKDYGVYHALYFTGTGETLNELHRHFRLSDGFVRFQTIKVEHVQESSDQFVALLRGPTKKISADDMDGLNV